MQHTYLFEEGTWNAHGIYIDETGNEFPVEGRSTILHREKTWEMSGFMRVFANPPAEFNGNYEIDPFTSKKYCTKWSCQNPALGDLRGNFVVINDSILSVYTTKRSEYTGCDTFAVKSLAERQSAKKRKRNT